MKIAVLDAATLGEGISLDALSKHGEVAIYDSTTQENLISHCAGADVLVLNKVRITKDVLIAAPSVKLICVTATGYDNIDVAAAKERGVAVANVPAYSTSSVALYTLATVTALVTHIREYNKYVIDGSYTASGVANKLSPIYHEIAGMTWGIIGYGNIGRAVGAVAEALGARVIVNKRTPIEGATCVGIEQLCRESDIITIHCPLNANTREMINAKTINLMKNNVIIVNEARGAVVNESDIADAIEQGRIGGFGSDVYTVEPIPSEHPYNRIMRRENVLLTPHAAWGSLEARIRCVNVVSENIAAFIGGKTKNRVDI